MYKGARSSAVVALLVIVSGLAIAACGSSNSGGSASASASGGGPTTSAGGTSTRGGFFSNLTAAQKSCLKSKGVTNPTGGFGRRGSFTGTGTFTRPTGTPPAGGGYPGGGYPGGGTSTTGGGFGPGGGRGFGGGGFAKDASAFKACGITLPTGRFGGGAPGAAGGVKPTAAALKTFVACVVKNGYDLRSSEVNTTGKGSILPKALETNKKFLAAAQPCERDLFAGRGPAGAPGAGAPGGAPPAGSA